MSVATLPPIGIDPNIQQPNNLIVTICGSMDFYEEMMKQAARLTSEGYLVLFPFSKFGAYTKEYEDKSPQAMQAHEHMQRQRISLSNGIFVVNLKGYIGESTASEITFARGLGKTIHFLVPLLDLYKQINQSRTFHSYMESLFKDIAKNNEMQPFNIFPEDKKGEKE